MELFPRRKKCLKPDRGDALVFLKHKVDYITGRKRTGLRPVLFLPSTHLISFVLSVVSGG